MNESEYVKVELEKYEDLIATNEKLKGLLNAIYKSSRYVPIMNDLALNNPGSILFYLSFADDNYSKELKKKKEEYENKNKGDE